MWDVFGDNAGGRGLDKVLVPDQPAERPARAHCLPPRYGLLTRKLLLDSCFRQRLANAVLVKALEARQDLAIAADHIVGRDGADMVLARHAVAVHADS